MQRLSQFISEHIPWFWGVLAWSLVVLTLLTVAAIVAYFILYPIASNLRQAIQAYLKSLFSRHEARSESRRKSMEALIEEFRLNSGIKYLSEHGNRIESAFASFSKIAKKLRPQLDRCVDVPKKFEKIQDRLLAATSKTAPPFPDAPPTDRIIADDGSIRIARVRLSVSSVILLALIIANTGMLSQILREFIPHELVYFGIPLYVVLALVLTIVEAGVGVWHAAAQPSHEERGRVKLVPAITICFALVIACVEGFFYSRVAPNKDSIFHLPFDFQVKEESLFFLWGAALVLVLFGLGSVWMTSLERVNQKQDFPSILARISKTQQRYSAACESAERSGGRVREQTESVHQNLVSAAQQTASLSSSLVEMRKGVPAASAEPPTPRPLTSTEAYHFMHIAALWLLLTLGVLLVLCAAGYYGLGQSFPLLSKSFTLVTALGLSVCFVVLGLLVPRGELFLDGHGDRRLIVSGSYWRGRAAIALATCIVCGFVALLWQVRLARHYLAYSVGILVLGASLVATSSQAIALAKGLRLWFHSCWNFVVACLEAIWRIVGRILFIVSYVIEVLALGLAAPIFLIRGSSLPSLNGGTEPPVPKTLTARKAS